MIRRHLLSSLLIPVLLCAGCSRSSSDGSAAGDASGKRQFISMGTAPVGGAFPIVGQAICEVLNQHKGTIDWKLSPKGTKGSQENIRRLQQNELELGMSNAAISYFAVRGEAGWNEKYDIRAIATLAPNVAMFIARADSGIQSISDLKGKRVITGPAGAGFQMFVEPILAEHGVAWSDITSLNATQSDSVDQLADGSADAAFLGGAMPTSSISQASSTFDVHFIPFDEAARQALIEKYPFLLLRRDPGRNLQGARPGFHGIGCWVDASDYLGLARRRADLPDHQRRCGRIAKRSRTSIRRARPSIRKTSLAIRVWNFIPVRFAFTGSGDLAWLRKGHAFG